MRSSGLSGAPIGPPADRGRKVTNLDFTTEGGCRNTGVVRTYGQYCPIARGAEIFAERWTPLIIRNLYLGCGSFSEILEGAPGLSRTLLSQRLKQLERLGVVESAPKPDGRGHHYELTSRGPRPLHGLPVARRVGCAVARDRSPRTSTPLWPCGRCATRSAETGSRIDASSSASTSPAARAVSATGCSSSSETPRSARRTPASTRTSTSRRKPKPSSNGTPASSPGPKPPARAASKLDGPPSLVRAFPTWNARSMFAHIRPVSRAGDPTS